MKLIDLSGRRFGMLSVNSRAGLDSGGNAEWSCTCDCGAGVVIRGSRLRSGETASCGCLRSDADARSIVKRGDGTAGKGAEHRRLYSTWTAMRARCLCPSNKSYHQYGGRGITVCERWMESFDNFAADMGEKPTGAELDRIDNNAGYSPENCRWTDRKTNSRNRRSARMIDTPLGRMMLCEAIEVSGISFSALQGRLSAGWSVERLFDPVRVSKANDNAEKKAEAA